MQNDDTHVEQSQRCWQPQTPNFRAVVASCLQRQEFMKYIGCQLTAIEPGYVEACIEIKRHHYQHEGLVHGGVIATIADVVAGFAVVTLLAEHQYTVTVNLMLSYLNAAMGHSLCAKGYVIRHGTTTSFARSDIYIAAPNRDEQQLVAIAQATFAIRQRT